LFSDVKEILKEMKKYASSMKKNFTEEKSKLIFNDIVINFLIEAFVLCIFSHLFHLTIEINGILRKIQSDSDESQTFLN
jgi:hypothetical protein